MLQFCVAKVHPVEFPGGKPIQRGERSYPGRPAYLCSVRCSAKANGPFCFGRSLSLQSHNYFSREVHSDTTSRRP
jgi:hypothetical protein